MEEKKLLKNFKTHAFRSGTSALGFGALALAAVIVINLFVSALPENLRRIDTTSSRVYAFSGQTETLLERLDSDVSIYCIVQSGSEDPTVDTLLSRYADKSSHIKVEYVDPVLYPGFTANYTDEQLTEGSLIIESPLRYTIVNYDELYNYQLNDASYAYDAYFTGESVVTGSIDFVTGENLPTVYALAGHGELEFDSTLASAVDRQNIALEKLSLLAREEVPETCQCLILCSPAQDISEKEKDAILAYLKKGGNLLLFTDYTEEAMPNLHTVLEYYGLSLGGGIIIEGDTDYHLAQYPHYLLPDILEHTITSPLYGSYYVLEPVAEPILLPESAPRDTVEYAPLLQTSSDSYMKRPEGYLLETYEFEEDDEEGPFVTGLAVTEDIRENRASDDDSEIEPPEDSEETRIVLFSSAYLTDSSLSSYVAGANEDLVIGALDWMSEREEAISISPKLVSMEYLSMSEKDSMIGAALMLGLPIAALTAGAVVLAKRRGRKS